MYKNSLLLLFSLLLVSCASPEPQKRQANEKAFEAEDTYILYALYAEKSKEHSAASSLFNTLYEKSEKKEYLYRSLENDLLAKNSEQLITRIDAMPEEFQDDVKLIRLKVVGLFELNRLAQAQKLSIALAKKKHKSQMIIF
jgi:hypothetical protein